MVGERNIANASTLPESVVTRATEGSSRVDQAGMLGRTAMSMREAEQIFKSAGFLDRH